MEVALRVPLVVQQALELLLPVELVAVAGGPSLLLLGC